MVAAIQGRQVSLRWPLSKPFRDRGDGTRYEIVPAEGRVTRDLRLLGLKVENRVRRCCELVDCLGLTVRDCVFAGRGALSTHGRFISLDYRAEIEPDWSQPVWRPYYLALDTCTSDVDARVFGTSAGVGIAHVHEGVANARLMLNLQQASEAEAPERWPVVSVQGLSWNVTLRDLVILNSPLASAVESRGSAHYRGEGNAGFKIMGGSIAGRIAANVVRHTGNPSPHSSCRSTTGRRGSSAGRWSAVARFWRGTRLPAMGSMSLTRSSFRRVRGTLRSP